jgi:CheY-like chemotaxis protein
LQELREEADTANRTKSNFLASMSHEIRTPMNAVIGMAELLLRGELSDEARAHAQDIKQAGNNLVSIINDILDFSKIEAGKLEIIPVKYLLSSLINDSVNIVCMRIGEKPLRFFTNINGNIPNGLFGDEVRLRQILLNLLSNAVKYSEKGHIGLTITIQKRDNAQPCTQGCRQVWLKITVADTGKGIKPEDQGKLFGEFAQVDMKKNRGIEGTGLGLAITRRLCITMGGDIFIESEYGKGSAFTAVIPQGIDSDVPFATVEESEKKKVLVYERRKVYAESVCWSLENLRVPYTLVTNQNDFTEALKREEWFYVFSGYGFYESIKPVMESAAFPDGKFPGGKQPPLALMVEFGNEPYIPDVRFVSLPVQSLSIANVLNGKTDSRNYSESSKDGGAIRFTFPGARLLVVDDIATNLKVAEGLLAPYQAAVDTCLSGVQAIELAKQNDYDIVLMDHMMPEMDGIEATAAIRAWEKERQKKNSVELPAETQRQLLERPKGVPIIALTANAVMGMREMFIENGFNDFLAKPIDVSKLDGILDRWIPKEKRGKRMESESEEQVSDTKEQKQVPTIPGVDVAKGIAMTGGTLNAYRQVLTMFRKDAEDRLPLLQTMPETDALPSFVTQVHALKSASASTGAAEVSSLAAELEAAGKIKDTAFIQKHLSVFAEQLAELAKRIEAWEKAVEGLDFETPAGELDHDAVTSLLHELAAALQLQKADDIDYILEQLLQQPLEAGIKTTLEQISDEVLMAEYGKAGETLDRLLNEFAETSLPKGRDNQ